MGGGWAAGNAAAAAPPVIIIFIVWVSALQCVCCVCACMCVCSRFIRHTEHGGGVRGGQLETQQPQHHLWFVC